MQPLPPLWRKIQRTNFTDWNLLADFLELSSVDREKIVKAPRFSLNLPVRLAEKMAKKTLQDPILKQFVPLIHEKSPNKRFCLDPVKDATFQKTPKLLQKYDGRALLITTSACAMHCRYCFRQNYDYEIKTDFSKEIEWIAHERSIREVILSGGDPLSLGNQTLRALLTGLSKIPHLTKIRFHTRFPIGIPERIDEEFVALLDEIPQSIWFVIHTNHPNELDEDIFNALTKLQRRGYVLLNASVLLKGVNDDVDTQYALSQKLTDHGILPYYLHQLDPVSGSEEFEVDIEKGKELILKLSERLPGYAVPKYVVEIPGQRSKTPLV